MTDTSNLDTLEAEVRSQIDGAADEAALDAVRVSALGKKGSVSLMMRELGKMSPEERKENGPKLNALPTTWAFSWVTHWAICRQQNLINLERF